MLDITYPPEHAELQERIACEGLLIAEQPDHLRDQLEVGAGEDREADHVDVLLERGVSCEAIPDDGLPRFAGRRQT